MSEPIKIVVTAQTAAAAAELQKIPEVIKKAKAESDKFGGALNGNRMAMMELGHVGRATAESLAFGMNPLKVLALESPRIIQSMTMMGVSLAAMAPYLLAVGAAAGAGYLTWQAYMSGVEDTTKANEDLVKSLDKVPALLEKINSLKKIGLISPEAAREFADYLGQNPKKPLYRHDDGSVNEFKMGREEEYYRTGDPFKDQTTHQVDKPGTQLTPPEALDYVQKNKLPQVSAAQAAELSKYQAAQKKINDDALTGLPKEIQLIKERNEANRDALLTAAQGAGNLIGPKQLTEGTQLLLEKSLATEKQQIAAAEAKADAERSKRFDDWVKKQGDAFLETLRENQKKLQDEEKLTAEKNRQLQLEQQINRAKNEAALAAVRGNPFLTSDEKRQQSIPLIQNQIADNQIAQSDNQAQQQKTDDLKAQLLLQRQFIDLQVQSAQLQNELATAQHPWLTQMEELKSQAQITMTSLAATFSSVFNTAISSISSGITGLIMGTMTWGQALASIGNTILTTVIQAIVQMGVRWVLTRIMMALVGASLDKAALASALVTDKALIAANVTPAALAAVATYGSATSAAIPVYAMASAGMLSAKEGGYTGDGPEDQVTGYFHAREFVFSAPAVRNIGLDNLESMHAAAARGGSSSGGGAGTPAGAGGGVSVYSFTNPQDMAEHLAKNDDHEKYIVDVLRRHIHRFR